jgi:hypothetical protein
MTYAELLLTKEWKAKRKEILNRDSNKCLSCFNERPFNQFSHGIVVDKVEKNCRILFNDLANSTSLDYSTSKERWNEIDKNTFILFEIKDRWISVISQRKLSEVEVTHYIRKPDFFLAEYTLKKIKEYENNDKTFEEYINDYSQIALNQEPFDKLFKDIPIEERNFDFIRNTINYMRLSPPTPLLPFRTSNDLIFTKNEYWYLFLVWFQAKDKDVYKQTENNILEQFTEIHFNPKLTNWDFFYGLHVHHQYYQNNCMPWEYPKDALITLCWQCHEDVHKNEKVKHLNEFGEYIGELNYCQRCFGAGWFPEYNYVQNGICFRCNGARYEELI